MLLLNNVSVTMCFCIVAAAKSLSLERKLRDDSKYFSTQVADVEALILQEQTGTATAMIAAGARRAGRSRVPSPGSGGSSGNGSIWRALWSSDRSAIL